MLHILAETTELIQPVAQPKLPTRHLMNPCASNVNQKNKEKKKRKRKEEEEEKNKQTKHKTRTKTKITER